MLNDHNEYVQKFKTTVEQLTTPEMKIVIRPDRRPTGTHARQYNAPVVDDVAAIMSGEEGRREIVLEQRSSRLVKIYDTNRAFDALQYPLIHPYREDGYSPQVRNEPKKPSFSPVVRAVVQVGA